MFFFAKMAKTCQKQSLLFAKMSKTVSHFCKNGTNGKNSRSFLHKWQKQSLILTPNTATDAQK
jgi:hypothetical protein